MKPGASKFTNIDYKVNRIHSNHLYSTFPVYCDFLVFFSKTIKAVLGIKSIKTLESFYQSLQLVQSLGHDLTL